MDEEGAETEALVGGVDGEDVEDCGGGQIYDEDGRVGKVVWGEAGALWLVESIQRERKRNSQNVFPGVIYFFLPANSWVKKSPVKALLNPSGSSSFLS